MSTTTTNYGFVKPSLGDSPPDITTTNPNWDTIDAELKDHADAIDVANDLISTKATKSTVVNKTLLATSWTGSEAPYSYTLSVSGVTATSVQEIFPTTDITSAQLSALQNANIQDGGQTTDSITLKAWVTKPLIDLPISVMLRGDM